MIARKEFDRTARTMSSVDQSPRILLQMQKVMQPQAQRAQLAVRRPKRRSPRAWSLNQKRELKIDRKQMRRMLLAWIALMETQTQRLRMRMKRLKELRTRRTRM
jgi:hypothetical protein